jgi:hypothetical protein
MERLSSEDSILLRATIPANPDDLLRLCCYQIKILNSRLLLNLRLHSHSIDFIVNVIPNNLQSTTIMKSDPQQFKLGLYTIY